MATSPEMQPPGFEIPSPPPPPPPPPSESTPPQIESLNHSSPETGRPGFENLKAACLRTVISGNDTWDPPPSQDTSPELPPLETSSIGDGNKTVHESHERATIKEEEMMKQPITGTGPLVSETLHPHLPEPEVAVLINCGTVDLLQPGRGPSETKTLEPLLEPPENEDPMACQTVGPPEAHSAQVKTEIIDPAMLVPPPPPSPPPETSEQTLIGDGLVETHRLSEVVYQPETQVEEQPFKPVPKPEMAPQGNETPPEPVYQAAVPESESESLGLPPSPPPLPLVSESMLPESSCENLNPPPPALIVPDMPKSMVLKSEYGNFDQYTCEKGSIGDKIPSEHETSSPQQQPLAPQEIDILDHAMLPPPPPPPPPQLSPPPQFKCESVVPSVPDMAEMRHDNLLQPLQEENQNPPNREMEMVLCPPRDETPDVLSYKMVPPVNQVTNEPPLKKSRNMHEMQDQLRSEVCQPVVEKDPLVSGITEMGPHEEEDMEGLQIDMDMSDDEISDRSPIEAGPPGSDTRDFETLEENLPGYDTIDPVSQTEIVTEDALRGMGQMVCGNCHELISYPHGAVHVLCTCCQTINLVLQACQVGNITCGQCAVLLMYPFGAPSVRCSSCRYVTEIGAHNMRPPLSFQREGFRILELQLTESS